MSDTSRTSSQEDDLFVSERAPRLRSVVVIGAFAVRIPAMGPELGSLAVQIVRFVDDHFPGFVACEFADADNRLHALIDKVPMVTMEDLDATTIYPQTGGIRCTVLQRYQEASVGEVVRVSIGYPDGMETTDGLREFVVRSAQVTWIPRGHREEDPPGVWRWVDDE